MKKSQATFEIVLFMLKIAFTIAVVLVVVSLTKARVNEAHEITDTEFFVTYYGFVLNENIMLTDNITGRVYPNIIDLNKFTDKEIGSNLKESFFYSGENYLGAKLILEKKDKQKLEVFLNPGRQRGYQEWIVLADSEAKGSGGAIEREFIFPVLYYNSTIDIGQFTLSIAKKNG